VGGTVTDCVRRLHKGIRERERERERERPEDFPWALSCSRQREENIEASACTSGRVFE
jgi:hypothetical protein